MELRTSDCDCGCVDVLASLFLLLLLGVLRSIVDSWLMVAHPTYLPTPPALRPWLAARPCCSRSSGPHPFSLLRREDQPHGYHPPFILPRSNELSHQRNHLSRFVCLPLEALPSCHPQPTTTATTTASSPSCPRLSPQSNCAQKVKPMAS